MFAGRRMEQRSLARSMLKRDRRIYSGGTLRLCTCKSNTHLVIIMILRPRGGVVEGEFPRWEGSFPLGGSFPVRGKFPVGVEVSR